MNNTLQSIIRKYLIKFRSEFLLSLLAILTSSFIINITNINESLKIIIFTACFFYIFKTSRATSIISTGNNLENFNWKYLLNLPLNNKQKIFLITTLLFLSNIAFIILVGTHAAFLNRITESGFNIHLPILIIDTTLLFILIAMKILGDAICLPRRSMQKFSANQVAFANLYYVIKIFFYFSVFCFVLLTSNYYELFDVEIVINIIRYIFKSIFNWGGPILLSLLIMNQYRINFIYMTDEVASFIHPKNFDIKFNLIKSFAMISILLTLKHNFYFVIFDKHYVGYIENAEEINDYIDRHKNNLNKENIDGLTITDSIIKSGKILLLQKAIESGANLNHIVKANGKYKGYNTLYFAILSGNIEMIKYIQSKEFDISRKTELADKFPIHVAIEKCNKNILNYMFNQNEITKIKETFGENLIKYALEKNCASAAIASIKKTDMNKLTKEQISELDLLNKKHILKNQENEVLSILINRTN